jgi:Family of unknown function (DUF5908)
MTIEIKQLVIRAIVEDHARTADAPRVAAPIAPGRAEPPRSAARAKQDRDALVADVVRQVMRQLRRGKGR